MPEETFRSSKTAAKCSIVTLKRFDEADETAWTAAWGSAHAAHDAHFNTERDTACSAAREAVVTGGSEAVARALAELEALGVERTGPGWVAGDPLPYPRLAPPSRLLRPKWGGAAKDAQSARALKKVVSDAFTGDVESASNFALRALSQRLKSIDAAHSTALWARVRELFDYPVFVAAPKAVGISSTGDTGEGVPNELPDVLKAWRTFRGWLNAGAPAGNMPDLAA